MNQLTVAKADPSSDVGELVRLNREAVSKWYHYDDAGRRGTPSSWRELSRLERWMNGGPWVDSKLLSLHLQVVAEAGGVVLVARRGGRIVGMLDILLSRRGEEGGRGHILKLTAEQKQREDTVEALIEATAREAKQRGCLRLTTLARDKTSTSLYGKLGFQSSGPVYCFVKQLSRADDRREKEKLKVFHLDWEPRPDPPFGFTLAIGDVEVPRYTWALLRRTGDFHKLMGWKTPQPKLWLLRHGVAEALTVDNGAVRLWLSPQGLDSPSFMAEALKETERLSLANGVKRMKAYIHPHAAPQAKETIVEAGYAVEEEIPYLELPL